MSRRQALTLGAAGAGSLAVGLAGLGARGWPPFGTEPGATASPGPAWSEPRVITATAGVLDVDLTVARTEVTIDGRRVSMVTYNGTVPGPTLRMRPGDRLRVHLANELDEPTNLHTHGLLVSPTDNGDNPFLRVAPGETFDYEITLPADHPPGLFWYHPHHHGTVADQVFAGLYGAILIDDDGPGRPAPRVVVVSDTTFSSGRVAEASAQDRMRGRVGETLLTNGLVAPELVATPGSTQRLLVVNACTSRYLDLSVAGQEMRLHGVDSGVFSPPLTRQRVVLAPGNRADLEIQVPGRRTGVTARAYPRGAAGMGMMGSDSFDGQDAPVLTLRPGGREVSGTTPSTQAGRPHPAPRDLRGARVDRTRTLTFTMGMGGMGGMGGMQFLIDGRAFDADRVDQRVELGTVEEWTIRNATMMDHPFHLHVWPMQVVDGTDAARERVDVRDVVDVPAGGQVVVRIAFARHAGATVYHCHILDHEDLGMMGVVVVR
ncbi:multicopper oxidase family protein [Actinotalea lenta]|uniref:multicopper oxidase family protein n=1 Tax=Actinotalea lenta TaxID=3064654 RepID=UPI0033130905